MSQWFDMWSVENHMERHEIQVDGLRESVKAILDLIQAEAVLISLDRIILGGISQGCAAVIHALLYGGIRLGGFIGLSSWLLFEPETTRDMADNMTWTIVADRLYYSRKMLDAPSDRAETTSDHPERKSISAIETPVFLAHCEDDDVVPVINGKKLCATLEHLGMAVSWKEYEDGGDTGSTNLEEWMTLYPSFAVSSRVLRQNDAAIQLWQFHFSFKMTSGISTSGD